MSETLSAQHYVERLESYRSPAELEKIRLGACDVVGRHLVDEPRDVLYELARSTSVWERRTAILSTLYFVRRGDVADTFRIAEMLLTDSHDLIHKAVGGLRREAGKQDRQELLHFLDVRAATMSRTALRYATEHYRTQRQPAGCGAGAPASPTTGSSTRTPSAKSCW